MGNCYKLQVQLVTFKSNPTLKSKKLQSPTAFPTISGFVYDLLKRFSLDNFTLYSLKEDPLDWKYSEGERQFASYMQLIHPHLPLQSTFTSNLGAPRLNGNGSKMRSDGRLGGVNCANSIEIEFMGDFHHHANKSTFPPFPTKLEDFDFTHHWKFVNADWDKRANAILEDNPQIKQLMCCWSSQWEILKANNQLLREMIRNEILMLPTPLVPRESLIGCRSELYKPFWTAESDPSRDFFALDVNSQFSYLITQNVFSSGRMKRYLAREIRNLITFDFEKKKFIFNKNQVCSGYVKALVLPTRQNDVIPALYCKIGTKTGGFSCKKCFLEETTEPCKCHDLDKMCTITCTFVDLEYAFLENSIKVLKFHEVILFEKQESLGKTFFNCIHREVTLSKGFPKQMSLSQQRDYVSQCNSMLNLHGDQALKLADFKQDLCYKRLLKIVSTYALGRLGTKQVTSTKLCSNSQQLQDIFATKDVSQFQELGSRCLISFNSGRARPSRSSYLIFLSEIYSYSRRHLRESAKQIMAEGGEIVNLTVDAIQFVDKKGKKPVLSIGPLPGQWKHVYEGEKVTGFFALSNSSSITTFQTAEPLTKICGLQMSQILGKSKFVASYMNLVETALLGKKASTNLPQTRHVKQKGKKVPRRSIFKIKNTLSNKRYYKLKKDECISYPYGYKNDVKQ